MRRLVSLLLVPFFLLGQALPHSHAGTGVLEPDEHSIRAHIHLAGGHHHDHDGVEHHHVDQSVATGSKTPRSTAFSAATDHDSDAFYLAETNWTASRTIATPQIDSAVLVWTPFVPLAERNVRKGCRFGDPPDRYAGLPIYLLTASLRL